MTLSAKSPLGDLSTQIGQTLLGALTSGVSAELKAMARNLISDHRIPSERLPEFLTPAGSLATMDEIRDRLFQYQIHTVRPDRASGNLPAYESDSNAANSVHLSSDGELCTVLNLTRGAKYYVEADKTFRMPEFRAFEFDDLADYRQVNVRLSEKLADPSAAEGFLRVLFRARNRYLATLERKRHPMWAARWSTVQPLLTHTEPRHWLSAVGVLFTSPAWLVVVKYPVESARRKIKLYRPTQLDAGWYAQHFPSPPDAPLLHGGHTMFLTAPPPPREPTKDRIVSEYIHQEVEFDLKDWVNADRRIGYAEPWNGELSAQRRQHWLFLQSKYDPKAITDWMPNFL